MGIVNRINCAKFDDVYVFYNVVLKIGFTWWRCDNRKLTKIATSIKFALKSSC